MEQNDFDNILQKLTALEVFKLFDKDNESDRKILKDVYANFSKKNFDEGEIIIKEGDEGDLFYILIEGNVQIIRNTQSGDAIAIANLNDKMHISFGEAALIGNDTRSATVKAVSACKTITISGKNFLSLCEKEPVLGYKVLFQLAKKMKNQIAKANNDIATLYDALFKEIESLD